MPTPEMPLACLLAIDVALVVGPGLASGIMCGVGGCVLFVSH